MADGKVTIDTSLNNDGVEKGVKSISGPLGGLETAAKSASDSIQKAFSGGFSKAVASAEARVRDLERQFETVSIALKDALAADDDAAAERAGNRQIKIYDQLEFAREKLRIAVEEDAQKQAKSEEKAAAKTAKEQQKYTQQTGKSFETVGNAAKKFGTRLRNIVAGALVFNIVSKGLRSMTDYFGRALKENKALSRELAKLKAALLTAFQPIYNFVVPVLTTLVKILTKAVQAIAMFFSMLSGKSLQANAKAAESLYKEADAIKSVGSASKKASKSLASFDEINALQEKDTGGGGSTGVAPDFSSWIDADAGSVIDKFIKDTVKAFDPVKKGFNEAFTADVPKLKKNWETLVKTLKETFGDPTVQSAFEDFRKKIAETSGKVVGAISSITVSFTTGIVGGIGDATERLKDFNKVKLTSITKNMGNAAGTAGDLATACAEIATVFEGDAFQGIVEFFAMLGDVTVMEGLDGITGFFSDLLNFFVKPFTDNADKLQETLGKLFEIVNLVLEPAKELIDKIAEKTTAYEDSAIHKFFVDATNFASSKVGKVLIVVSGFLDHISDFLNGDNDFGRWFSENVAPVFSVENWEAMFENIRTAFSNKWTELETWWNTTLPNWWNNDAAPWFTEEKWKDLFSGVRTGFENGWTTVKEWWDNFTFTEWWENSVEPWFTISEWEGLLNNVQTAFDTKWAEIEKWWNESALGGLWDEVISFFDTTKWGTELSSLSDVFKTAFTAAANAAIRVLNDMISWINDKLKFTIPKMEIQGVELWPKKNVTLAKIPNIPYLAQGAVLPPNKPFMAMVGDQRHGTNIEAPLSTIQEAVALVMHDQTEAILAGFEASVGVQREILEAVLGIQIGDDVIGSAVARYSAKQAVIRGGIR